jgi:hypothetical protein
MAVQILDHHVRPAGRPYLAAGSETPADEKSYCATGAVVEQRMERTEGTHHYYELVLLGVVDQ